MHQHELTRALASHLFNSTQTMPAGKSLGGFLEQFNFDARKEAAAGRVQAAPWDGGLVNGRPVEGRNPASILGYVDGKLALFQDNDPENGAELTPENQAEGLEHLRQHLADMVLMQEAIAEFQVYVLT